MTLILIDNISANPLQIGLLRPVVPVAGAHRLPRHLNQTALIGHVANVAGKLRDIFGLARQRNQALAVQSPLIYDEFVGKHPDASDAHI